MSETSNDDLLVQPETIKNCPLGVELSDVQCATLAAVASLSGLKEGDLLLEEGARDDALYVITKGRLEVIKCTGGGDCAVLQVLGEGDMTGELGFIDGAEHSAGLRSVGYTEVVGLQRSNLETLLHEDPDLVYKVMRAIMRNVHAILRRMNIQYVELTNYIHKQHGRY
jgi:CRP/FNR family cyclic AMP-dependent transcriptional regulator